MSLHRPSKRRRSTYDPDPFPVWKDGRGVYHMGRPTQTRIGSAARRRTCRALMLGLGLADLVWSIKHPRTRVSVAAL